MVGEHPDRVRRICDLKDEGGELRHVRVVDRSAAPQEVGEGSQELLEPRDLVERAAVRLRARVVVAAGAVAAPVHRSMVRHAAQALRGHRSLHGVMAVQQPDRRGGDLERPRDGLHRAVRIAEIPGQAVEVAGDVATGAGRIPVARGERRVVEERPPGDHARRLGVVHGDVPDLPAGDRIDDRDRVVEAGQRVEAMLILLQHQAGEAAARHLDLVGGARRERIVFQGGGVEDADLGSAERRDVQGPAVAGDRDLLRQGEALVVLGVRDRVAAGGVVVSAASWTSRGKEDSL